MSKRSHNRRGEITLRSLKCDRGKIRYDARGSFDWSRKTIHCKASRSLERRQPKTWSERCIDTRTERGDLAEQLGVLGDQCRPGRITLKKRSDENRAMDHDRGQKKGQLALTQRQSPCQTQKEPCNSGEEMLEFALTEGTAILCTLA